MRLFLLLLASCLVGCSDDGQLPNAGGSGGHGGDPTGSGGQGGALSGGGASGGGGQGPEGGNGGEGGEGGGPGPTCVAEPMPEYRGIVHGASSTASPLSNGAATFIHDPKSCSMQRCGDCTVTACTYPYPIQPSPYNAGPISITGGSRDIEIPVLPDGSYDSFATYSDTEILFTGGEPLTFSAPGGEVPAFVQVLEAPSEIVLTSPPLPSHPVIPLDADLSLSWEGMSTGVVVVLVQSPEFIPSRLTSTTVSCEFPVSDGAGVIPAVALQTLPPTDQGLLQVATRTSSVVATGSWSTTFSLHMFAESNTSLSGAAIVDEVILQ